MVLRPSSFTEILAGSVSVLTNEKSKNDPYTQYD